MREVKNLKPCHWRRIHSDLSCCLVSSLIFCWCEENENDSICTFWVLQPTLIWCFGEPCILCF